MTIPLQCLGSHLSGLNGRSERCASQWPEPNQSSVLGIRDPDRAEPRGEKERGGPRQSKVGRDLAGSRIGAVDGSPRLLDGNGAGGARPRASRRAARLFVRLAHHTRWPGRVLVEAQGDRQGLRPARAPRALRRPRRVGFINSIRLQIRRIGKRDRVFGPHATGRDRSLLPSAKNRAARRCGRVDESEKESTGGTCVPPVCVSLRYDALCQMPNTAPVGSWMIAKRPIFGTSIGSLRIVAPSSFARATVASASCVAMYVVQCTGMSSRGRCISPPTSVSPARLKMVYVAGPIGLSSDVQPKTSP